MEVSVTVATYGLVEQLGALQFDGVDFQVRPRRGDVLAQSRHRAVRLDQAQVAEVVMKAAVLLGLL